MFGRKKDPKSRPSYVTLHNNAVLRFQKSSRIFIWAGIVNFVGLIIGNIQYATGNVEIPPFYFCFGVSDFAFSLLYYSGMNVVTLYVIAYIVSFVFTGGAVALGVFSSQAKKKALFAEVIIYFVDWVFVLLAFFIANETWIGLLFNGGIHAIITFFLVIAVYEYYNVFNIEKRFEKVKKEPEVASDEPEGGNQDGND